MNSSLSGLFGFLGSYFMAEKKRVDMISAMERQEVGWPDSASVVASMESRRRIFAISLSILVSLFFMREDGRRDI